MAEDKQVKMLMRDGKEEEERCGGGRGEVLFIVLARSELSCEVSCEL
jgi:hypothetical protein